MEDPADQTCDALVDDMVTSDSGVRLEIQIWCGRPATCHVTQQKFSGLIDRYYCDKHRPNVPGSTLNWLSGQEI